MAPQELGRIEEVDIRSVWPDEAKDFTPWLAKNLDLLGSKLGLELELTGTEVAVGSYSLDVLAKEAGDVCVSIENQLEQTDHRHLGQLLTYAAGHDAKYVVWVARSFKDEHRAAIDWLNQLAPEKAQFYGVEIHAIKIGDSPPAPYFRVVASPDTNFLVEGVSPQDDHRYRDFFQPLISELGKKGYSADGSEVDGSHYRSFSSGISSSYSKPPRFIGYRAEIYPKESWAKGQAGVNLWLRTGSVVVKHRIFDALEVEKAEIEAKLSTDLRWYRRGNDPYGHVALYKY